MQNDIVAKDPKKGNIFYVEINKTYYFLQIIHIEQTNDSKRKFGYFLVVFDKTFKNLPSSIGELDLQKIYQPKYLWKKTTLYTGIWNSEPCIQFRKDLMYYDFKDKYKVTYFGNAEVSKTFSPELIMYNSLSKEYVQFDDNGIQITHQPLALQVVLWGLEQEEKGKTKKKLSIKPEYFKEWIEDVEPANILKTEKIIATFEKETATKAIKKMLKRAVLDINKLDEKYNFITTIEAENIYEKLVDLAIEKGISEQEAEEIIDENRKW